MVVVAIISTPKATNSVSFGLSENKEAFKLFKTTTSGGQSLSTTKKGKISAFHSDGDLVSNDWKEFPLC